MKYYLIAGEASGDLHGGNLITAIRQMDPDAVLQAWGGDFMESAGARLVKHFKDLAFMGFAEVVKHLPTILGNLKFCKKDILAFAPDVLILIDYPGFNLRIAKWAKQHHIKVAYYISPQVWAWKESRVPSMKKNIDEMMVILPFEKEYFLQKWNWNVTYVGHPLVEVVDAFYATEQFEKMNEGFSKPVISLLPGSRKQEILKKLPLMLEASKAFPDFHFMIAKAPGMEDTFYESLTTDYPHVTFLKNKTYALLSIASASLTTSGTATLETALFGVPEVVCYKGNPISYRIARKLIKIKYISLVNLIMDKEVVKELIQDELTVDNLIAELKKILEDQKVRLQMKQDFVTLKNILSAGGHASSNAAKIIYGLAKR
ncbi:MAG: lipid-A-disaccharide synthase [Bacteroidetes bacterium]|nr:lipid-A-disaccharide synthase [Bacteroidota bacterium]